MDEEKVPENDHNKRTRAEIGSRQAEGANVEQLRQEVYSLKAQVRKNEKIRKESIYKSPGDALALSAFTGLFGFGWLGLMYMKSYGEGIGALIISFGLIAGVYFSATSIPYIGLALAFVVAYVIFYVWQINRVCKLCVIYDQHIARNGIPPW